MATFKAGDTATIRTSGEVVFIQAIKQTSELVGHGIAAGKDYFQQAALVSRPVATREGIDHRNDIFFLEELESQEDRLRKDYESFNKLYTTSAPIPTPDMQVSN